MKILEIVKKLYPFDYSVAGEGNDRSIKEFKKFLKFKVHNFNTNKSMNGWKIPQSQKVISAEIFYKKKKIFDALKSPFNVISQSESFKGEILGKDLIKNIYSSKICPEGIPYNWTGLYRPDQKIWGFCTKKSFVKSLKKNNKYYVNLKTKKQFHPMRVLDFEIKGKSKKTIIINAHNCHKYQANDDISGCAVGIRLFEYLKKKKDLKYSYRLLIAPELFGPMFWLTKINKKNILGAILLKAVGNRNKIKLQNSFNSNSILDAAAENALKSLKIKFQKGGFREIYGNDETVFEAPGNNIPSITFTRFPFKQYHTDQDKPKFIKEKNLVATLEVIKKTIDVLEKNFTISNTHTGLICLSNKKYNLYKNAFSPGILKQKYTNIQKKWNLLMNCLPMEAKEKTSIMNLSKKYNLDFFELYNYLLKWKNKKLIKFE
jgi:aminopeptidase-like protein